MRLRAPATKRHLAPRMPLLRSLAARAPARNVPWRLRVYLAAVALAAALALGWDWAAFPPHLSPRIELIAASLAMLVAVARAFPVRIAPKRKVIVDTAPAFAAVLLLPPTLAVLTVAVGMLAGELQARGRWFQVTFNTSVAVLKTSVAALLLDRLAAVPTDAPPVATAPLPAILLVAVAMHLLGSLLVDIAAGLTLGQNPFTGWTKTQRGKAPHEAVLFLIGVFAALPADQYPWMLPLLIVPAAVVRRSLQQGLHVKSETREALEALSEAVDLRHQRAADHSRRVAELARAIARRLELSPREIELVTDAARLRDVGEVALPPDLLVKAGPLTDEERNELNRHATIGAQMVERFADFVECAPLIRHHHERWDGWGSPLGLTGEAIPLGARIIAVAETYEALIAARPYREALSPSHARDELRRSAGAQLDPRIAATLLAMLGQHDADTSSHRAVPPSELGGVA